MRDPKRIKEILSAFEEVWKQNPDLRFCQLVVNITRINDSFYIEDDIFLNYLKDIKNVLDFERIKELQEEERNVAREET